MMKIVTWKLIFFLATISFFLFFCHSSTKGGKNNSSNISAVSSKPSGIKHDTLLADLFIGDTRTEVKTSFVNSIPDTFYTLKKLHNWLTDDEYMHLHTDANLSTSPRTKEENHNVCIPDVYIFAVKT